MFTFARLSLARQFLLASFLILLVGMLLIGTWIGWQIERGVLQRTSAVTALYVDSLVGHHLPPMAETAQLDPDEWAPLDLIFADTPLGRRIVTFKLWGPDGRLLYSPNKGLIGNTPPVPVEGALARAFEGEVQAEVVTADQKIPAEDDLHDPQPMGAAREPTGPRLIRSFAPVHSHGSDRVVAVAEFQQTTEGLDRAVSEGQQQSWAVVGVATIAMYALLAGLVGRASVIISRQQAERQDQVRQLTTLLEQNAQLSDRVHRAAARSTSLNEQFLRRLSSDLHDGPCQDLGLALLRFDAMADSWAARDRHPAHGSANHRQEAASDGRDLNTVQLAIQSALNELRTISAGLWLPELEPLAPAEVAERAVREYEVKTGADVARSFGSLPPEMPLPVKITLYRVLQEALSNGFRHAPGSRQEVRLSVDDGHLHAEIADSGSGFDPQAVANTVSRNGHLGLVGMRERVEVLGGVFGVQTMPGQGTVVQARLPLSLPEDDYGR
jgi:signal transduction histidine kinase